MSGKQRNDNFQISRSHICSSVGEKLFGKRAGKFCRSVGEKRLQLLSRLQSSGWGARGKRVEWHQVATPHWHRINQTRLLCFFFVFFLNLHRVEQHGEGEVFAQRPGGPRQRHEHAEHYSHPEDAPDVVHPPPGLPVFRVQVPSGDRHLAKQKKITTQTQTSEGRA